MATQDWRSRHTLKVEEVAPILGISRSSAYDAARSGEIPTLRIGRRLVVPTIALRRMLGEINPVNESSPAGQPSLTSAPVKAGSHDEHYSD